MFWGITFVKKIRKFGIEICARWQSELRSAPQSYRADDWRTTRGEATKEPLTIARAAQCYYSVHAKSLLGGGYIDRALRNFRRFTPELMYLCVFPVIL